MAALILDFDGTLVDSEPLHGKALRAVLSPLGIPFNESLCVGLPDADVIRAAFKAANRELSPSLLDDLMRRKSEAAAALWHAGEGRAYPGAVELIHAAKGAGLRVGVCTAALRREAKPVLERLGVLEALDAFTTADDVTSSKPDPECYRLTASRLGIDPSRCVALEDSVAGVASAAGAGCRVVGLLHTTARERLNLAWRIVPRISDIAAADIAEWCRLPV